MLKFRFDWRITLPSWKGRKLSPKLNEDSSKSWTCCLKSSEHASSSFNFASNKFFRCRFDSVFCSFGDWPLSVLNQCRIWLSNSDGGIRKVVRKVVLAALACSWSLYSKDCDISLDFLCRLVPALRSFAPFFACE